VHAGDVFLEYGRVSEVLATARAVKLLDAGVDLAVPRQHRETLEALVAHRALKRTIHAVYHLTTSHQYATVGCSLVHFRHISAPF